MTVVLLATKPTAAAATAVMPFWAPSCRMLLSVVAVEQAADTVCTAAAMVLLQ